MTELRNVQRRYFPLALTGLLLLAGCRSEGWQSMPLPPPTPLPPWPERSAEQLPFLFRETESRLNLCGNEALFAWRRLAGLYQHLGQSEQAVRALDRAAQLLDKALATPTQQSTERSALADQYLALKQPERARGLLTAYRYQGVLPTSAAALKRTTLTENELRNLKNLDILLYPRLLLALVDQGPQEALRRELQPRLDFTLMRGPEGGRTERFHSAILLQFHLSKPEAALKGTELQPPQEQLRTLSCLLWGGTIQPSAILFQRDRFKTLQARVTPPLKAALEQRLTGALGRLTPDPQLDIDLAAVATLAQQSGAPALATLALTRMASRPYQAQAHAELPQGPYLSLPPVPPTLRTFERSTFLGRNLGRIMGLDDSRYQEKLIEQFFAELKTDKDRLLFSSHVANLCWKLERPDLIDRLLGLYPEPAFQCHQTLKKCEWALKKDSPVQAAEALKRALAQLPQIHKVSHQLQEAMLAVDLARKLKDRTSLGQLRTQIEGLLPQVTIMALRTEGKVYLAGLHHQLGDRAGYEALQAELHQFDASYPFETLALQSRLQRMATELNKLKAHGLAVKTLSDIRSPLIQANGLMELGEALVGAPPQPLYGPTASLQNGPGAGRGLGNLR
ncbi:hypothetical protein [Armatimonas rosea]|uniref:Tetratricopeptide repeat protein n=1 Tax=Armatimonas rosea TaxID=685828 RepID=A0A7W9SRI6_ARMRO|nr:hypothetical protein [Armatimonas rosea]MBB6051115.1 hypothetical protein [Armatimonas rosea]